MNNVRRGTRKHSTWAERRAVSVTADGDQRALQRLSAGYKVCEAAFRAKGTTLRVALMINIDVCVNTIAKLTGDVA
jgi:hypothetical protein